MPRFSEKSMELFDTIWNYADIKKLRLLMEKLENPEDIIWGKIFTSFYYVMFANLNESMEQLKEIEQLIKINKLNDPFVGIFFHSISCLYYTGYSGPMIDKEKSEQHLEHFKQVCLNNEPVDDWEELFIKGWYFFSLAYMELKLNNDRSKAIELLRRTNVSWEKINNDNNDICAHGYNMLGFHLRMHGEFEEASKILLLALEINQKYDSLWQFMPLVNLGAISAAKGNLQKALEYNTQLLTITKKHENEAGGPTRMSWALGIKSMFLYAEGHYDESLKINQESLRYDKQTNEPWRIFNGYFSILEFHNNRYSDTRDEKILLQAKSAYQELTEFSSKYPQNKNMGNFSELGHALILKHGNMRKKSKAMDIYEEQTINYPHNIAISYRLLELLFEDVVLTGDQETIEQIDGLITKIGEFPLRNNPQAVFGFVSQKIVIAKYHYYIKGDISTALEILHGAKDHILGYKLINLNNDIEKEIGVLEKEITKWDKLDISVKERIKKSEFNKYVQEALKYAKKQV